MIASKDTLLSRDPKSFKETDIISKKNEEDLLVSTEVSRRVDPQYPTTPFVTGEGGKKYYFEYSVWDKYY
tara:strand:+ start:60 stop:269 length:210 start_codon:yes stop_codon:yes gene_type:complete